MFSGELEECAYQNHLHRLRLKNEKDSKTFFVFWMNYAINQRKMYIQEGNRTTIPNLSSSRLKNFRIPRPPFDEQHKITYILSTIQTAQEKTKSVITALNESKKAMMKHLFMYGPVNLEEAKNVKLKETEIGEIPEGWNISKLAQVARITMGQSPPGDTYNEENKGMPFLQGKAEFGPIHPTHIKYTSKPLKIAKKDSILLSVRAPVGDVNIANINYCIGRGLASISSIAGNNLFLFYLLMFLKQNIEKEGTGSTFKAINKNKLQNLIIPDPPTEIQEKIASVLWTIDEKIEMEKSKKNSLNELFKSMLHNLMTAKIRVNELVIPNEEK
jgi:type I restriction enzyme S subunit